MSSFYGLRMVIDEAGRNMILGGGVVGGLIVLCFGERVLEEK